MQRRWSSGHQAHIPAIVPADGLRQSRLPAPGSPQPDHPLLRRPARQAPSRWAGHAVGASGIL
jgi:hypothetical protein